MALWISKGQADLGIGSSFDDGSGLDVDGVDALIVLQKNSKIVLHYW